MTRGCVSNSARQGSRLSNPYFIDPVTDRLYGKAKRIWVMDRGMISEENVRYLQEAGRRYIVGTPKGMPISYDDTSRKLFQLRDRRQPNQE